jgi:hypothetical protein
MIVPFGPGKFNIVRLTDGTGLHLEHPQTIAHQELSGSVLFAAVSMYLASLGWEVTIPLMVQPGTRYFKISGTLPEPLRCDCRGTSQNGSQA